MQHLEVSGAVRPLKWSLGVKWLILSSHPSLVVPSGFFPSSFPTKTLYTPLLPPIRATCPGHLILLDFITKTILDDHHIKTFRVIIFLSIKTTLHKSSIPYKNSQLYKVHDTLNSANVVCFWFILVWFRNCKGYVPSHVMTANYKWGRVCKESILTCCNVLSRHLSGQTLKQATKSTKSAHLRAHNRTKSSPLGASVVPPHKFPWPPCWYC